MTQRSRRLIQLAEAVLPAWLMRRLRVAKFERALRTYPRRVVEHSYGGVRHKVLIASAYGERNDMDWPALQEIEWLKRGRLRAGARVFDLGASHGVVAMMLADAVGPEGHVVALEAHPYDAGVLRHNRELNDIAQIEPVHAAVARVSGAVTFGRHGAVDDGTRRWGDLQVPAYSIDDLSAMYGEPDVVFIDVEGYELEALRGADQTLGRGPDWFVEVHDPADLARYGATTDDVLGALVDRGYRVDIAFDVPYAAGPNGEVAPIVPIRPLEEVPADALEQRFFALATRARA